MRCPMPCHLCPTRECNCIVPPPPPRPLPPQMDMYFWNKNKTRRRLSHFLEALSFLNSSPARRNKLLVFLQVNQTGQAHYKYLMDIGGQSGTTWTSLNWKMAVGALVFKVDTGSINWWCVRCSRWPPCRQIRTGGFPRARAPLTLPLPPVPQPYEYPDAISLFLSSVSPYRVLNRERVRPG